MNLEQEYAGHVRKHLGYFPVWPPGDAVAPCDVGLIEHGSFRRQGSLAEVFPSLKAIVDSRTVPGLTRFRSDDCSATSLAASGDVPTGGVVTVTPSLRLTFGSAGGAVFDALDCTERYISNLLEIRAYIDQHRQNWPPHLALATRITDAKSFVVLISASSGASVDLSGDAKALGSWSLADASIKTSNEKNVGYEKTGNGPILVGLYAFGWFGTHLKVLSATEKMAPETEFKELPARDAAFD